jgi:hypothetical protein
MFIKKKKGNTVLLKVFLRMLSTAQITQNPITGRQVNNELETAWKQAVMA